MKATQNYIRQIKRHLSANGSLLLPLALKWRLLYMAVGLFTLLILPGLAGQRASAATITLEVPSSLSLTLQPDGAFHSQSSATPVKITSDAFAGYDFSIMSSTGSNALTNGEYSLQSILEETTSDNFVPSAWGWQYSKGSAEPSNAFLPGPTEGTQIDHTDEPVEGETEYTITIGAKVDSSIPNGSYSGSFTLMVTANPVPYSITYNQNTEDTVSDIPDPESGQSATGEVVLSAKEPKRDDFRFLGWCMGETKKVEGIDTCNDENTYKPGNNYALTSKGDNIELFAMWTSTSQVMQNWGGCKYLTKNTQTTLVDIRDNRLYYVSRFADNNCWMTENLDLFLDSSRPLTPADSDVRETWTPPTTVKENEGGIGTWYGHGENAIGDTHPQSYDFGNKCWLDPQIWESSGGASYLNVACAKHDSSHYHVGNYYNYSAAVAQDDTSNLTEDGDAADTSICPSGWQLPSHTGPKSFANLQNAILADDDSPNWVSKTALDEKGKTQSTIHADPYYFNFFGLWGAGHGHRDTGVYRTNAVDSIQNSYVFAFHIEGLINPTFGSWFRNEGDTVRCVTRDTMQNVDEWGKDVEEGETVTVMDRRDGNTYRVRRLADGKLWMIDNLRLGDSRLTDHTLTAENTDLNGIASYTLANSSREGFESDDYSAEDVYVVETDSGNELKAHGGYYTYNAATAGTGVSIGPDEDATSSICPKGWRMPTGGSGGDFETLYNEYASLDLMQETKSNSGPEFLFGAEYENSGPAGTQGNYGGYWSSTVRSTEAAYRLRLERSPSLAVDANNYDVKYDGESVRCIAR